MMVILSVKINKRNIYLTSDFFGVLVKNLLRKGSFVLGFNKTIIHNLINNALYKNKKE